MFLSLPDKHDKCEQNILVLKNILFQLTFVDEVGSQLDGLDLSGGSTCHVTNGNGNDGHVSHGSGGRQLVPGLLYIDDKKPSAQHKVGLNVSFYML